MTSSETALKIYKYLLSKGVTKEGACAIIANLQAESALIPNNLEDSYSISFGMSDDQYTIAVDNGSYTNFVNDSAGYGLAQWTYFTRKHKLLEYAKLRGASIGNLDMQLEFLVKEFQEDFSSIWNQLRSSNNLYDLTSLLLNKWENPAVKNISVRYQFAQNWQKTLTTTGGNGMTVAEAIEKVLNVARSNIGYHESGNNIIKFAAERWDNEFYGWELQGQPWCDVFADYCYCQPFGIQLGAAITYQRVGSGSALCSASAQYYKNNGAWYTTPQPGDQVFFYVGGGINHTGIVESVNGSQFTTIEGNTSDMVARRTYYINGGSVAGFGRPKWSLVTEGGYVPVNPTPSPTPTTKPASSIIKHGARGEAVKTLQENLIKLGYDCGPDGADGQFGYNTLKAVTKFQREHNLEVDGQVGPLTQAAIEKALKEKNPTPAPAPSPSEGDKDETFQKGDRVRIKDGATYYGGALKVPNFVLNDTWIIYSISGDRAVINKNVSGTSNIMSPINTKYLEKV